MTEYNSLTEEQKEFVKNAMGKADSGPLKEEEKSPPVSEVSVKKRFLNVDNFLKLFIGISIASPIIANAIFYYFILRLELYLGDSIGWLSSQDLGSDFNEAAQAAGLPWIPGVLGVYDSRWVIMAAVFVVGFVFAAIFMSLRLWVRKREGKKRGEQ